ncbi:hypothetical protein ABGV49_19510 [Chromobacterium vaccinii]|uniref:Uncharacterized protein n=1 Tax=Chromobacterium vaccinii TaxID=1108595 RepID=A0ABV0FGM1_9NEIS
MSINNQWEWAEIDIPASTTPWPTILNNTWAPLIRLSPATPQHPLKLGNINYLLDRLVKRGDSSSELNFPLTSFLSPPDMRLWLALRAGESELSFRMLPTSRLPSDEWLALQDHVKKFDKLDTHIKPWLISTLAQLTLYEDCVKLAQGQDFDLDQTQDSALAYEIGRALQRIDFRHKLPIQIFKGILSGQADSYLRVASAIQFMVRGSRFKINASMAKKASQQGEKLLVAEHQAPRDPFRHAVMYSRFYRAEALVSAVHGSKWTPAEAIEKSDQWHTHAEFFSDHSPEHQQLLRENKRLVIEACLKLATRHGDDEGKKFAEKLIAFDGSDPDCLAFVGNYWLSQGNWRLASTYHLRAMRRGTVRSVLSAITAGDLLVHNGHQVTGLKAYQNALVLDARSITAQKRIGIMGEKFGGNITN